MKIRPVGAELFHTGGRTDRHDKVNSHFFFLETRLNQKQTAQLNDRTVSFSSFKDQ